jgi:hypothetical protein
MAAIFCFCVYWFLSCCHCGRAHGSTRCEVSHRIVRPPCQAMPQQSLTKYSPVLARSVMGMYGSFFFVFIRAVVCIIWYGIQTFYAGNLLSVMLRCIFGSSWENFGNTLPASANITSKQLLTFFIAWILEFPFVSHHMSSDLNNSLITEDVHTSQT